GGSFQYNKDPNSQIYTIRRYDRQEGKTEDFLAGPGGACRPQVSNDGKKLAFVRRVRSKTALFVHDLETGEETFLTDQLSKDQQEAWAVFGIYPGFAWMPDDKQIVIWAGGKILKIDASDGKMAEIPFTVRATHKLAQTLH